MHLQTHALASWLLAEAGPPSMTRRDRCLVLVAGLAPDLDALTILGGVEVYQAWHRLLLHNVAGAAATTLICAALAHARPAVALLALVSFHLHLGLDLLGSAGPDGSIWGIPYLAPFSRHEYSWAGQWGLGSWPNVIITAALLLASWAVAVRRGRTLIESLSIRGDAALVEVLRRRWPASLGGWQRPR